MCIYNHHYLEYKPLHIKQKWHQNLDFEDTRCIQLQHETQGEFNVNFLYTYKEYFEIL